MTSSQQVTFIQNAKPPLAEGRYAVSVTQTIPGLDPGTFSAEAVYQSWTFTVNDMDETLAKLLAGLNAGSGDGAANALMLPVSGNTVSFYRGPLVPLPVPAAPPAYYSGPDAASAYDPQTGLFDVSYGAAWQLGQLLAPQNSGLANHAAARGPRRPQPSEERPAHDKVNVEICPSRVACGPVSRLRSDTSETRRALKCLHGAKGAKEAPRHKVAKATLQRSRCGRSARPPPSARRPRPHSCRRRKTCSRPQPPTRTQHQSWVILVLI